MRRALTAVLLVAFLASPRAVFAQRTIQIPSDRVTTDSAAPVAVSDVTLGVDNSNSHLRVCFAFRNLALSGVTSVEFHVGILDQFDNERISTTVIRNANSQFSSGRRVNPPDPSASGYTDTNDGTQSCWLFSNTAEVNKLQGMNDLKLLIKPTAVRFADGTTWRPGDTFTRAYNADGSAYVLQTEPFDTTWSTEPDTAPVAIVSAGIRSYASFDNQPKMEQCTTFRNITNKPATSIRIGYVFSDASGNPLPNNENWHDTFDGTYTPPILIENKCWTAPLPAKRIVRAMRSEVVRVTEVHFSDGSQWKRGDGWTKAYNGDGSPLPSPLAMSGVAPPPGPNPSNPNSPSNAGGLGGVIGPSGQLYGEVAWDMSFDGGFGIAVNQASEFDAQYQAMSECKSRAGANAGNCTLIAKGQALNSPSTRCATLISDGHIYRLGVGATPDDADVNAITTLRAAGGSPDAAKTIAKGCNNS